MSVVAQTPVLRHPCVPSRSSKVPASTDPIHRPNSSFGSVYDALAEHQVSGTWDLRDLLRKLHHWVGLLAREFKLEIPDIALRVDQLRVRWHGHFRAATNGFGLQGEVALNRRDIDGKELWEILGTLLHLLLHAWQKVQGKPAKGFYHNVQFRRKAAQLGLLVQQNGYQEYEPNGRFVRLLRKHRVDVPNLPVVSPSPAGSSKLNLWICRCDPPFRVRVARQGFAATCKHCSCDYFQQDESGQEQSAEPRRTKEKSKAELFIAVDTPFGQRTQLSP